MARFCDGITRRDFVRVGAIGSGLGLASYLRLAHAGEVKAAKATSAISKDAAGSSAGLKPGAYAPLVQSKFSSPPTPGWPPNAGSL